MRHAPATFHFSSVYSRGYRPKPADAIEWEELPSLAGSLARRIVAATNGPWDATRPAELEPATASQPVREPVDGLAIREVTEPDVFRHFFGS
ncbi:MAG: hypothetical protein ABI699_15075 [Caldimonas sp.]